MDSFENPSEGIPVMAEIIIKAQEDKSWAEGFEVDSKVLDLTVPMSRETSKELDRLDPFFYKSALEHAVEANGVWGSNTQQLQLVKVVTVRDFDPHLHTGVERILVMRHSAYREQLEKLTSRVRRLEGYREEPEQTVSEIRRDQGEFDREKDWQEEYRRWQAQGGGKSPMEHTFEVVGYHYDNLDNVRSVRKEYPEEYEARMHGSLNKPERNMDGDGWYNNTWAGRVLLGVLSADSVDFIERNCGGDRFGIPSKFLEIPHVQELMTELINQPNIPKEVKEYLRREYLGNPV